MSLNKIFADKELVKDAMQGISYFAFIPAVYQLAIPSIKGNGTQIILFLGIFITLQLVTIAFTLLHVVRPIVQKYYPEYTVKGIDRKYTLLTKLHPANFLVGFLSLIFIGTGVAIIGYGIEMVVSA